MRVAERNFAHFSHKVLQILPRNIRREILHDDPVFGAKRRRATIARRRVAAESRMTTVPAVETAAAASPASATAAAAGTFGELDAHAFAVEAFAVEILDGVFGVADVIELDEAEPSLEDDVAQTTVTFEESLQILLASARRKTTDEKSSSHCVILLTMVKRYFQSFL